MSMRRSSYYAFLLKPTPNDVVPVLQSHSISAPALISNQIFEMVFKSLKKILCARLVVRVHVENRIQIPMHYAATDSPYNTDSNYGKTFHVPDVLKSGLKCISIAWDFRSDFQGIP